MKPLVSQIADVIVQRLRSVTIANGYNQNLTVERPTRQGILSIDHLKCVLIQSANLTRDDRTTAMGAQSRTGRTVVFGIVTYLRPDDNDPTPIDDLANSVAFDCIAAVSKDDDWYRFGGLAISSDWLDIDYNQDPNGAFLEVVVGLQVQFRTKDNAPALAA